jgi:hypothetical protein
MDYGRRNVLAALGVAAAPLGLVGRVLASPATDAGFPVLHFRSFEDAVRGAFSHNISSKCREVPFSRRIPVGDCELLRIGIQGCHNDRPFAGFPTGRLRIIWTGSEPGPAVGGVRLYISTVEIALLDGNADNSHSRPLNFAAIPPAPSLFAGQPLSV